MRSRLVLMIAVTLTALGAGAAVTYADGDPASDVLLGQNVFYPYSPTVTESIQKTLNAETAAAVKAGFPIKVALIAAPTDLGVIPGLFDKPQKYADFLDQEISFQNKQMLLVVMPAGYGTRGLTPATTAAAAKLTKPANAKGGISNGLATAAITAVAKLATAAGHPIKAPTIGGSSGGSDTTRTILLIVLVLAILATAGTLVLVRRGRGLSQRPT